MISYVSKPSVCMKTGTETNTWFEYTNVMAADVNIDDEEKNLLHFSQIMAYFKRIVQSGNIYVGMLMLLIHSLPKDIMRKFELLYLLSEN